MITKSSSNTDGVAAFNERAIRLYRRVGFVETGRHTETVHRHGAVEFIDMEERS